MVKGVVTFKEKTNSVTVHSFSNIIPRFLFPVVNHWLNRIIEHTCDTNMADSNRRQAVGHVSENQEYHYNLSNYLRVHCKPNDRQLQFLNWDIRYDWVQSNKQTAISKMRSYKASVHLP